MAANVDLALVGHDHTYQRFAPMDNAGQVNGTKGIREFVVGTGGASHYALSTIPGQEARNADTFGVLRLTLHAGSYDWRFVPEPGRTYSDSGSTACH
jgi:hypothetical protein